MGIIRFLLALSVFAAHIGFFGGFELFHSILAVEAFYIISGFLIAYVLSTSYKDLPKQHFYFARYLRLAPVYWLSLALTIHFFRPDFWGEVSQLHSSPELLARFSNLTMLGLDALLFLGLETKFMAVQPAWTLSLELYFYILAPYLKKLKVWMIAGVLILSLVIHKFTTQHFQMGPWDYRFFPSELMYFLLGMLGARAYVHPYFGKFIKSTQVQRLAQGILLTITLLIIFYNYIPFFPMAKRPLFFALFAFSVPFIFHITHKSQLDRKIGDLSYPIYILHILCAMFIDRYFQAQIRSNLQIGVTLAFTIFVSALLNETLEKYVDRFRHHIIGLRN